MNSTFIKLSLFLTAAIMLSWDSYNSKIVEYNKIKKAAWLIGVWECKTSRHTLYETWAVKNDSVFMERSYFLKGVDTVYLETVSLEEHKGALFYIPTLKDENNGLPVVFKNTFLTGSKFVFENPEHDFPQKITYTHISADSLIAETSGTVNGQFKSNTFPMKKIK